SNVAKVNTVYVDDDFATTIPGEDPDGPTGPATAYLVDAFPTIQQAIDVAAEGGTVLIAPGVYNENVLVNVENLTLRGATGNPADVVLDGNTPVAMGGIGITVAANNVTIQDLRITDYNTGL